MSATDALARQLVAEATASAPDDLPPDASIHNFEAWDSMAHMRLLLAIEERTGTLLSPEVMVGVESLSDVIRYLAGIEAAGGLQDA